MPLLKENCTLLLTPFMDKPSINHVAHGSIFLLMYGMTPMPTLNWLFLMGMILSGAMSNG